MKTTKITIKGMSCGHCVAAVTRALERVPGVEGATVTLATGEAIITHHESTTASSLVDSVGEQGYGAELAR